MTADRPLAKASDFDPEVLQLFDQYVHGLLDRRGFIDRASRYAVGGATGASLLAALSPRFAEAQQVAPTDPRLKTEYQEFDSPRGYDRGRGYLARPARAATKPLPAVLVVHENRGLNPHIEDIARRLALDNFIAFAPDALFSLGGYPGDEDKAREKFGQIEQAKAVEDFVSAAEWLRARPECNGRLGAVGFCWGGGMVNTLATRLADLKVAAPFYGPAPALDKVPAIQATMLFAFADADERVNASWPPYEAALKAAGKRYEAFKYAGTQHGFNNDTTPRYDEPAANRAWNRTLAALERGLRV